MSSTAVLWGLCLCLCLCLCLRLRPRLLSRLLPPVAEFDSEQVHPRQPESGLPIRASAASGRNIRFAFGISFCQGLRTVSLSLLPHNSEFAHASPLPLAAGTKSGEATSYLVWQLSPFLLPELSLSYSGC